MQSFLMISKGIEWSIGKEWINSLIIGSNKSLYTLYLTLTAPIPTRGKD